MIDRPFTKSLPLLTCPLLCLVGSLIFGPARLDAQSLRSQASTGVLFYNTNVDDAAPFDNQEGNNGSAVSASGMHSFTGADDSFNTRTMGFVGQASASATYGRLHSTASGTITNAYYNANNTPYIDPDTGQINPDGSPEALYSDGVATFSETLQYGGVLQAGYQARFIFHLDGINSGSIDSVAFLGAFLGATVAGSNTEYFYAAQLGNVSMDFATTNHFINGNTPQTLTVSLQSEFQVDLRNVPAGANISGSANFSNTLTLTGVEIVDADGNPVSGVTVTTNSGVPINVVPEPTVLALCLPAAFLLCLRRRKKAAARA